MKKVMILAVTIMGLWTMPARADVISFADSLIGVDGDTSSWSTGVGLKNLGTNVWSLLSGDAFVLGYDGSADGILSHRLTRGLGIMGEINDQVDSRDKKEMLEILFSKPYYFNSFEVRSFFDETEGAEEGADVEGGKVDYFLNGDKVGDKEFDATRTGGIGKYDFTFNQPKLVDAIRFYVPKNEEFAWYSDFAVAKLDVTPTPEPISAGLFLLGGGALAMIRRKNKAA